MAETMASGGVRKKRMPKWLCGVPLGECRGSLTQASNGLGKGGRKMHSSPQEAASCQAHNLVTQGYAQVGPREFSKGDGPIVVLTKKSRAGARVRGGKGSRYMPESKMTGGTIIS